MDYSQGFDQIEVILCGPITICIIRVGWGSLALGNLCIPLVLSTVFVCLVFL